MERKEVFLFSTTFRLALGPTQPFVQWGMGVISPGIKWLGSRTDHSPPSSVKVKNGWSYTSIPNGHLYGTYRGNLHYTSLHFTSLHFTSLYLTYCIFPQATFHGTITHTSPSLRSSTEESASHGVCASEEKKLLPNLFCLH